MRTPDVDLDAVEHLGWGVALWLHATDSNEVHGRPVKEGVPIVVPPFEGPFGTTFVFTDPDGYRITVHDKA